MVAAVVVSSVAVVAGLGGGAARAQSSTPSASHGHVPALASESMPDRTTRRPGGYGVLLQQRGSHALNGTLGLPAAASRPVGPAEWQVAVEHSNTFSGGVRGREILLLDGESTELTVRHRRRLGECWQVEAALPFVAHSNGWADRAIDDWHQSLGLPDAERDTYPLFDLNYLWIDAKGRRRQLREPTGGLGDIQLAVQRTLGCREGATGSGAAGLGASDDRAIARLGIKLPSGDPDALTGSGATDVFADLQSPVRSLGQRFRVGAAIGVLAPGRSPLFGRQRPFALFGAVGLELRLHERWRVIAQLDAHSPLHDSELRELGQPAASLGIGLRYLAGRNGHVEFSIGEDALVDTTPDIVARLAWTWRPTR